MVPDSVEWLVNLRTVEEAWGALVKGLLHSRGINEAGAWLMARMRKWGFSAAMGLTALMAYRVEVRTLEQMRPLGNPMIR